MFSKIVIFCFIGSLFIQVNCLPASFGSFDFGALFNSSSLNNLNGNRSLSGASNNQSSDPASQIQSLIGGKLQLDQSMLNNSASGFQNALPAGISDPSQIPQVIAQTFIRTGIEGAKKAIDAFEQAVETGTKIGKNLIDTGAKIGATGFKTPLNIFSNFI